jgi:hypothetical protein
MRKPPPATGWRKSLAAFSNGLMFVLKPLQIVSNFVFLTVAYVLGVGASSLLYRLGPGKARARTGSPDPSLDSYWRELPPAPADRDSWLRPF